MNSSLFHRYYESQLSTMDTNPELRDSLHKNILSQRKPSLFTRLQWAVLTTGVVASAAYVMTFGVFHHPHAVTAEELVARSLVTPHLNAGEVLSTTQHYQESGNDFTGSPEDTEVIRTDGQRLERLAYKEGKLVGASLYLPTGNGTYDAYDYGMLRQVDQQGSLESIEHRQVYNVDHPETQVEPYTWGDNLGNSSITEIAAGSSMWRPYLTSDHKDVVFFQSPVITEEMHNGVSTYHLHIPTDNASMDAWLSHDDGRILEDSLTVTPSMDETELCGQDVQVSNFTSTTVYDTPVITHAEMPASLSDFTNSLSLSTFTVRTVTTDDFGMDIIPVDSSDTDNQIICDPK